jgi:hypothetical protein
MSQNQEIFYRDLENDVWSLMRSNRGADSLVKGQFWKFNFRDESKAFSHGEPQFIWNK